MTAAEFIESRITVEPRVAVVLGSGLGGFADAIEEPSVIHYKDIPEWPRSTAVGHAGQLIVGTLAGIPVAALAGRAHLYEGYTPQQVVYGIRALDRLGVDALILTNAAGAVNPQLKPGQLALISDHINLLGANPLTGPNDEALGPRFPDMSEAYSKPYRELAREAAKPLGIELAEGVYAAVPGPSYETPAEIRYLRAIGADLVGMSTVLETIAANHMGLKVLGISCVTNYAAGVTDKTLDHAEVLATGERVRDTLTGLLNAVIPRLLGSMTGGLIADAIRARENARAPFSSFKVGAALEDENGRVFTGCNIENATFGLTLCAERVAVFKALSEGARSFRRIVVAVDTSKLTPPCGACRQILWEFCGDIEIVLANLRGDVESLQLASLFPRAFDASFL